MTISSASGVGRRCENTAAYEPAKVMVAVGPRRLPAGKSLSVVTDHPLVPLAAAFARRY